MLTTTYPKDISVQEKLKVSIGSLCSWEPEWSSCHLGPACCSVGPTPDQDSAFPTVTLITGVSPQDTYLYNFSEEVPRKSCDTKTKRNHLTI